MSVPAADAAGRTKLGFGNLLTNDIVDGAADRWRTGSYASSRVWGPTWTGAAPSGFGDLLELRFNGEIITPENLRFPAPGDRHYAGALSLGLHTHMQRGAMEYAIGGDLVFVGPQTGLDSFQTELHDLLNVSEPSDRVLDAQIGNAIRPTLVVEMGRPIRMGAQSTLRPFVEGRAGVETLARVGFDWTFGSLGQGELLVRDPVAGQRYRVITQDWTGYSFTVGADFAYVDSSVFLPDDQGPALDNTRERVRVGVMWQGESGLSSFAGITYLGEEFEGQDEGQFVGSIKVRLGF
ncbi:lipid A-modifier LpxR family protein [uncultured Tateyamaria sp.]|nr:lipid A-modifier LpxR family protein [uncultured Tateyamaria sp.]